MAIYRRNYKPYSGTLTPAWSRCFILFRYSRRNLFRSKFLTGIVCGLLLLSAGLPAADLPRS